MATITHKDTLNLLEATSDHVTIGGKLRYYRKLRNLKQKELAELANLDVSTIKRVENNKVVSSIYMYNKIIAALNIDSDLIYDEYFRFINSDYSLVIKVLRQENKLTQKQFGDLLGVHLKTILRWEKGIMTPSINHYEKLKILQKNLLHLLI